MKTSQISKWFVGAVLFSGLITAFFHDLTGLELHQWIGVGAAVLAAYHLITHWDWVSAVTRRFFGKTSPRARLYYLVDASLLIGFFTISFTGMMISPWFDLALANAAAWLEVHILAAIGILGRSSCQNRPALAVGMVSAEKSLRQTGCSPSQSRCGSARPV